MTQQEFDDRMGKESTLEEYASADAVYMASRMEKNEFCEQYKKHDCKLLHEITDAYYNKENNLVNRKNQIYAFVKLLLNAASTYEDNSILEEVSKILGMDEYIRLCLSEGIPLTKVDRDYILNHLR